METVIDNAVTSNVTFFGGFNKPIEEMPLASVVLNVKEGTYDYMVSKIRTLKQEGNNEKADELKKQLHAFTPSATFEGGRKPEYLKQYSGFVHLDFDKLPPEILDEKFKQSTQIPYTYACFRSPSGNGFKVFVQVTTGAGEHAVSYSQVTAYYEKALGILSDPKCKDITRLCFVSSDPEAFINENHQVFPFQQEEPPFFQEAELPEKPDHKAAFDLCVDFTEKKEQYLNGNRNIFIYQLASNCNRKGIPEAVAMPFIKAVYDLPVKELEAAVSSAYKNHTDEFAKFAKSANLQTTEQDDPETDYLKATPVIPDDIFDKLPVILKSGCSAFTDNRERDVFLTGALSIISGCLPNVSGVYAQQTIYPNLFCFIIAPAASGKGAMKFSKMLADKEHANMLLVSREADKTYQAEINEFRNKQRFRKKNDEVGDPPEQPPFKVLFIPANASYAKILWHIEQNQGDGIICETEADTMGNVLKQEWGSYSDMLRKAFHHERLSSSKKTNNEYIEVNNPRLSVALSGTPSQVVGLIASSEDGLFSRFIFYAFKVEPVWRDVSPYASNINLTDHFGQLSEQVVTLITFLKQNPTVVELSKKQWDRLNTTCGLWLQQVTVFNGIDSGSIVKRLGIVMYRIAMIFTALRKFENGDASATVICTDEDFDTALKLAQHYLDHSVFMFHNLPRQDQLNIFKGGSNKQQFYDELPKQFKRAEAIELGKKHGLSERTIDNLLKKLLGKHLKQASYGTYSKD
jgi:hypothetical protein